MSKEAAAAAVSTIVYCIIHISHNDLPEFPSATLSSIDDATASPHSSALQNENSFYVILLKVDDNDATMRILKESGINLIDDNIL